MDREMYLYLLALVEIVKKIGILPRVKKIKIGEYRFLENFLALISMDGENILDKYYEDDWGLFVPSIRFYLEFFETAGFLEKRDDGSIVGIQAKYKKVLKKEKILKERVNKFFGDKKSERIETLVSLFWPVDEQKERELQMQVRTATCLWNFGMTEKKIKRNKLNKRLQWLCEGWESISKKESRENFPEEGVVALDEEDNFYMPKTCKKEVAA